MLARFRSSLIALALAVVCASLFSPSAIAAPGDLDPGFGDHGIVKMTPGGWLSNEVKSVTTQPDGKVLAAGVMNTAGARVAYVTRLNANGTPDLSFGSSGTFVLSALPVDYESSAEAIKVQSDQKIVVAGWYEHSGEGQLLFRLNPDGTLDTDADTTPLTCFGPGCDGYLTDSVASGDSRFSDVAVLAGGDLVAAGTYEDNTAAARLLVHRYNTGGDPNSSYDGNVDFVTKIFQAQHVDETVRVLVADNNEVVFALTAIGNRFLGLKVTDTGENAGWWGFAGSALAGKNVSMSDATLLNGVLTFAGFENVAGVSNRVAVSTVDLSGYELESFAANVRASAKVDPSYDDFAVAVRRLPSGTTVALVRAKTSIGQPYVASVQFDLSGQLDPSFGEGGIVRFPALAVNTDPTALEVLPDGKRLIGGNDLKQNFAQGFVARTLGSGYVPPPPTIVPKSRISSPKNSRVPARHLLKFRGTAGPTGKVKKVQIALLRVNPRLIKKENHCLWLRSSKSKFTKKRATKGKCVSQHWLRTRGKEYWAYTMRRRLPRGKYVLYVRVTAIDGTVQTKRTFKHFRVT